MGAMSQPAAKESAKVAISVITTTKFYRTELGCHEGSMKRCAGPATSGTTIASRRFFLVVEFAILSFAHTSQTYRICSRFRPLALLVARDAAAIWILLLPPHYSLRVGDNLASSLKWLAM